MSPSSSDTPPVLFQAEKHHQHQGGTDPAGSHHRGAGTCCLEAWVCVLVGKRRSFRVAFVEDK